VGKEVSNRKKLRFEGFHLQKKSSPNSRNVGCNSARSVECHRCYLKRRQLVTSIWRKSFPQLLLDPDPLQKRKRKMTEIPPISN